LIKLKGVDNQKTAKKAWLNPIMQDKWVVFDGVLVTFKNSFSSIKEERGERAICQVSELSSVFGENAHLTWQELLTIDY